MTVTAAVFGEALVDAVRTPGGTRVRPGGSPLNVAVGLARLGADVEFATSFGRDENGRTVAGHLAEAGVAVTEGSVRDAPTSVATATLDEAGHAAYAFEIDWDPRTTPLRPANVAHVGSISAILEPGSRVVREWAESVRDQSLVSYDPNLRPGITGAEVRGAVDDLAALADIVKVSAEDLDVLGGDRVERWLSRGTAVVLVTDGDRGVRIARPTGDRVVPAVASAVVDTVGAGDSFMAGLLWSLGVADLLDRDRLAQASPDDLARHAAFAAGCAAITVGREGADPPSLRDITASAVFISPS